MNTEGFSGITHTSSFELLKRHIMHIVYEIAIEATDRTIAIVISAVEPRQEGVFFGGMTVGIFDCRLPSTLRNQIA